MFIAWAFHYTLNIVDLWTHQPSLFWFPHIPCCKDLMRCYTKHFLSCIFGAHLSSCMETDKFRCYKWTWSHNINERKKWTLQTSGIQFIQFVWKFLPKHKIFFLCELHSFHACNDSESIKKSWLPNSHWFLSFPFY